MSEDWELERIRLRKLRELMRAAARAKAPRQLHAKPMKATDEDFELLIRKYPLVVVDFWAEWCGPCRLIEPVVEELAQEYAGKVTFLKLNVDENPRTAMKYNIMSIPTLMIFRNGKPIDIIVGALPKPMIESRLRRYL